MPRNVFDEELERLEADLAEMGRRIDGIMQGTIRTLKNMDVSIAKSIFPQDVEINTMEKSIERSCMNLIALQQPLARDLRVITATLKVITDLEHISDQCADICEILATVKGITTLHTSPRMLHMFDKAREMVAGAVDAYIRRANGLGGRRGGCALFLP